MPGRAPREEATPLTTIWLARHSEVHNPGHIYYGRLPRMGLSAEGQRQAEALADFLAARPLAAVYSSPLLRARQVAQAVRMRHPALPLRIDRDLIEVRTAWQGTTHADLDRVDWEIYATRPAAAAAPAANESDETTDETMEAILERIRRWLARMARRHRGQEIVGVTHGDPLLILLAGLRGLPLQGVATLRQAAGTGAYVPVATVARIELDAQGAARALAVLLPPYERAVPLVPAPPR